VRENVTISYQGAGYELGRGPGYYGIWATDAPSTQPPLEWWPETGEGWAAAWARFSWIAQAGPITQVGDPGTGAVPAAPGSALPADSLVGGPVPASTVPGETATAGPVTGDALSGDTGALATPGVAPDSGAAMPPASAIPYGTSPYGTSTAPYPAHAARAGGRSISTVTAAALLALGVVLGFVGLFPAYVGGASLASEASELVPHLLYLAAWGASAVLIVLGGTKVRTGALLGTGTAVVTLGLFVADAGPVISAGTRLAGAGLVLGLIGWLACAAGSAIALAGGPGGRMARPRGRDFGPVLLLAVAGIGTALTFAPSWDSYTLQNAAGISQSLTEGNAFSNPGPVIAGDVIAMIAIVAVAIGAVLWRPARQGAALLGGVVLVMAAQAISALVQMGEAVSPEQFGISPAQAAAAGVTISSGATPVFWVYCLFVVGLTLICAWLLMPQAPEFPARAVPPPAPPAPATAGGPAI
jgi:hypothetical protein